MPDLSLVGFSAVVDGVESEAAGFSDALESPAGFSLLAASVDVGRLSLMYQPDPLKTTPTF